jgi:hypothetical protein
MIVTDVMAHRLSLTAWPHLRSRSMMGDATPEGALATLNRISKSLRAIFQRRLIPSRRLVPP